MTDLFWHHLLYQFEWFFAKGGTKTYFLNILESFKQTHLKIVEKVHSDLPQTEEDSADSHDYDQVGDGGVGDILLWLGHTQ